MAGGKQDKNKACAKEAFARMCACAEKKRSSGLTDSESKEHRPVPPVLPVERLHGTCIWVQAFLERTASRNI